MLTQGPVLLCRLVPIVSSQLFLVLPMHGVHQIDQEPIIYKHTILEATIYLVNPSKPKSHYSGFESL